MLRRRILLQGIAATPIDTSEYFTVVALEDGLSVSCSHSYKYCINGDGIWRKLNSNGTVAIMANETLSFTGESTSAGKFSFNKRCKVQGPISSIAPTASSCDSMFKNAITLVDASELIIPSNARCAYMFEGCTSLINAPKLPATTLKTECYQNMFKDCTSLVTAPELPATTLSLHCYQNMFKGCTSLVNAPELPATTVAVGCYINMFEGCTSLVTAPALPATILADYCYLSMFKNCTSLINALELSATILADYCYQYMFKGCTSLEYIKMLATNVSADFAMNDWVSGVSPTGTFVKNSAATWDIIGVDGVPEGWTIEYADS